MKKKIVKNDEMTLVGIKVRTNNKDELHVDEQERLKKSKIMPCVQNYFHNKLAEKIPHRTNPGTTLCVYTEYESDETGDYTYFIGQEVDSTDGVPSDLEILTIPAQTYAKFTTESAAMPHVLQNAWKKILIMSKDDFGGSRNYVADFELYDERASDHNNVVLDIYIGIDAVESGD